MGIQTSGELRNQREAMQRNRNALQGQPTLPVGNMPTSGSRFSWLSGPSRPVNQGMPTLSYRNMPTTGSRFSSWSTSNGPRRPSRGVQSLFSATSGR